MDSYPVALVGRVPVHTMIEPGQTIRVGDRRTLGSIPGYAEETLRAGDDIHQPVRLARSAGGSPVILTS